MLLMLGLPTSAEDGIYGVGFDLRDAFQVIMQMCSILRPHIGKLDANPGPAPAIRYPPGEHQFCLLEPDAHKLWTTTAV